jgi:hypothetical protein
MDGLLVGATRTISHAYSSASSTRRPAQRQSLAVGELKPDPADRVDDRDQISDAEAGDTEDQFPFHRTNSSAAANPPIIVSASVVVTGTMTPLRPRTTRHCRAKHAGER